MDATGIIIWEFEKRQKRPNVADSLTLKTGIKVWPIENRRNVVEHSLYEILISSSVKDESIASQGSQHVFSSKPKSYSLNQS